MDKSLAYSVDPAEDVNDDGVVLGEKTGTVADRNAMARLGKEQLFKVSRHTATHRQEL
jgi:hypothetical protein